MKKYLPLLGLSITLFSGISYAQTYTPISVTGYDQDVVAENSPASAYTDTILDGSDYVLYNQDYGNIFSTGSGLPNNGTIVSGIRTYQLQPYTGGNAMVLSTGQTDSLDLATPASFSSISLLGFATEGAGTLLVVIKFTDGTASVNNNLNLPDWFYNPNPVIAGFDRTGRYTDSPDFQFDQPQMYSVDIPLSCADQARLVEQILIINTTPSPSIRTCVFAASGAALVSASVTGHNITCHGLSNGYATAAGVNGAPGYTYTWGTTPVQHTSTAVGLAEGTYTFTVTDASGCMASDSVSIAEPDSIVLSHSQTDIQCHGGNEGSATVSVVSGGVPPYTYLWSPGGNTNATATSLIAGTYTCTVKDHNNCQVSQAVTITEPAPIAFGQVFDFCGGESVTVGSHTYINSGTYTDMFTAANGCDSTVISTVIVRVVNADVTTSGAVITADNAGQQYQWYNCTTGDSIVGATAQGYTATANGSYFVRVTEDGCDNVSPCVDIVILSVAENTADGISLKVYPNPASQYVMLQTDQTIRRVDVFDLAGKRQAVVWGQNKLDVSGLAPGVYMVHVVPASGNTWVRRIVKQ